MSAVRGPGSEEHADPIQAPGTDEERWRAWDGWERLPEFTLPRAGRVVVVAAHPDDEVLGVGGAVARLADAGLGITVVSVTDGEGSHPGSTVVSPRRLARLRARELLAALDELGAARAEVVRLKVPDTAVKDHEDRIARELAGLVSGAALCLAPWTGDVHGDHEAAGRAAREATRAAGVPCALYPVWMWRWAEPGDTRVPWHRAFRVPLPPTAHARKRAAVDRFDTQIRPLGPAPEDAAVLPPDELAHHLRPWEVLFV
ncbi:glucosamine-6-phosphate deaminase-like protein [Streptomyces sp. ADI96-02]|uniref:PIG-L deacetylase family protein n=1 Tax=Streptomyces sp. ADI96-02 TaxID=1522760 RepID=UPI000F5510D1|nr:PIG-L family deacetylase [Streptomyces sp. ADI96-02]RPK69250.1 glucosamine-6-phosphate deaminase-like protein [Streptomyces sp. ADI96-02]